jgi:signal transduction histidine kinase
LPSVAGIGALLLFAFAQGGELPIWFRWVAVLSLLAVPAGFLVGLLRSRLARGGLADLFRHLPTMRGEDLQPALAQVLGDPTVEIVRGHPYPDDGRGTAVINDEAALLYDASLDDDPELIEAVVSAAAIALESRARLERIVTAGDDERRRLERNLHDGAQQRLVALAMQLRLVQHEIHTDPAAAQALVDSASKELALSLEELRELARGIHPAVLDHGLEPALHALAGQATVPTEVAYDAEGRLPEPIELAAYFVTSEALANVGKYARANSASVRVAHGDGELVVEIADDGIGGADAARGSGLRGLADRVEALDGRLRVVSPPGAGTVVRAELPCAS